MKSRAALATWNWRSKFLDPLSDRSSAAESTKRFAVELKAEAEAKRDAASADNP